MICDELAQESSNMNLSVEFRLTLPGRILMSLIFFPSFRPAKELRGVLVETR